MRVGGSVAAASAAALAIAQAGPGITGIGAVRAAAFPRLAGRGDLSHVALTFDDGPDPASTPEFLRVLADQGVLATFFMLGSMVARAPGLAAEVAAAGHEVGVHGWAHRYLPARGPAATRSDLTMAAELIADVTGAQPTLFRPPYGVLSGLSLSTARALGLTPLLWGAWGREWTPGATGQSVLRCLLRDLDGGVTVLLHDSSRTAPPGVWRAALAAVPPLLDECDRRGLRVGPVRSHRLAGLAE
ncbi:MAG TPA: polysaccharide deacetylase family protein [Streptosporangiaceae bacterium]|nr:polysaccharide deacetylase family protein [Streptosporangiaceae bacterium]